MVKDNESFKQALIDILELNFIGNKESIEKEMKMLNFLLTSFNKDASYSYDEFCKQRMHYETEACDVALDAEFNMGDSLSPQENHLVQTRISKKAFYNPEMDVDDIMKEEYAKFKADKICAFERKAYYQVFKYSGEKLVEYKLKDIYQSKKDYFDSICNDRARKFADEIADGNVEGYIEKIKSNLI